MAKAWQISETERSTDEMFEFQCSLCKKDDKNSEADKFCVECNDYFCVACIKSHDRFPTLKDHQILGKFQFTELEPTEKCKIHPEKIVNLYCKQHDVVACSECMKDQHRTCRDTLRVSIHVKKDEISNAKIMNEQLKSIVKRLSKLNDEFTTNKENLASSKKTALEQIRSFRKEINRVLNELEKNTTDELECRFQHLMNQIESELKELQDLITNLKVKSAYASLKSPQGNYAQMFVDINTAFAIASQAKTKLKTTNSHLTSIEMFFVANENLQSLSHALHGLGSIRLTEAILISGKMSYSVKEQSDRKICEISSACALEDGTLILADYGNNKLKQVDGSSYILQDSCKVPESPLQVCAISSQEIAVCCDVTKLIQIVSTGKKLQKKKKIKTGFSCTGLAYACGNLYVASKTSVYVYTESGERLHEISKSQAGKSLFSKITGLAVLSDKSLIYVSDWYKGLIILDRNNQHVSEYVSPQLNVAYGVCLNKKGSVFVSGLQSMNIFHFNSERKLLKEILKTDNQCQTVCCNKSNSQLILGFTTQNEIEVYLIS